MDQKISVRNIQIKSSRKAIKFPKDHFEKQAWDKNNLICGIDEVGRGCLAGPLVVAAVILKPYNNFKKLKDSKLLDKQELLDMYPRIIENSWHSFAIVNNYDIDKFNIWHTTLIAMKQAVMNLFSTCPKLPATILIDAMPLNLDDTGYKNIEINYFPKGESLSRSIAAASIIAKVKRDSLMAMYDEYTPGYEFKNHKGYGTPEHKNALSKNGQSILHRQTFMKKFGYLFEQEQENQTTLFDLSTDMMEQNEIT